MLLVIKLFVSEKAKLKVVNESYDPQYGARPVKRVLQKQVLNELSKQILADKVDQTKEIIVDVFNKQIVFRN